MKKQILILSVLCFSFFSATSQYVENFDLTESEFKSTYKFDSISTYHQETNYILKDTVYGISDEWVYQFEDNKLQHSIFGHYTDEIDEINFKKNLKAAQNLIIDFTEIYGKPLDLEIGDTSFVDPYDQRHWGYDVIEARWFTNGMKIKIEFDFFGGKEEYHFIFSVKYFDKDYPYFD